MFEKANTWLIGSASNQLFIVVLVLFQFLLLLFFMALLTMHKWHRHVLAIFYFVAAFSAYFADSYGVIIDKDMLINAAETNVAEALGLLSWRLLFYFTFLFALPSFVIYKVKIIQQSARKRILDHFIVALLAIVCFALILLASSNFSTSFFQRTKADTPFYSNPLSALYATYEITHKTFLALINYLSILEMMHISQDFTKIVN
jgi:lipid A ethanolaminephosphotransferase